MLNEPDVKVDGLNTTDLTFFRDFQRIVGLTLPVLIVLIAAFAIEPRRFPAAEDSSGLRSYLLVVAVTTIAAAAYRIRILYPDARRMPSAVAESTLVTGTVGLFMVNRLSLQYVIAVLALVTIVAFFAETKLDGPGNAFGPGFWASVAVTSWTAFGAIVSLDSGDWWELPLVAMVSFLAAIWLFHAPTYRPSKAWLVAVIVVLGSELLLATAFIRLSSFAEATLWVAGFAAIGVSLLVTQRTAAG